jgi:hypothetical protein
MSETRRILLDFEGDRRDIAEYERTGCNPCRGSARF